MPTGYRCYEIYNSNNDCYIPGPPKKGKKGKTLKTWEKNSFKRK